MQYIHSKYRQDKKIACLKFAYLVFVARFLMISDWLELLYPTRIQKPKKMKKFSLFRHHEINQLLDD
jgi:hypothetical protein